MTKQKMIRLVFSIVILALLGFAVAGPAAASIPVFRFVSPNHGNMVSGSLEVQVFSPAEFEVHTDSISPKVVRLQASNLPEVNMTAVNENLYAAKLDTTALSNGLHTLTATEITWSTPPRVESISIEVFVHND